MKDFLISKEDWDDLMDLSVTARKTPVMSVGSTCFASTARESIMAKWQRLGDKYKFDANSVIPKNERARIISAEPT